MKTAAIVALACLNIVLLGALLVGMAPKAQAQGFPTTDYLVVTGKLAGANSDAVYIIDLARGGMVGLGYDRSNNRMYPVGVRNLRNDFRRPEGPR